MPFDYEEHEKAATRCMNELKGLTNEELIMRGLSSALDYLSDTRRITPEIRSLIYELSIRSKKDDE